jgi:hypothetical protein
MSKPTDQATQVTAFEGMFPNVNRIREFYQLGKDMDEMMGRLVRIFVESDSLQENPALLCQFASLLNYALTIDRMKMMRPYVFFFSLFISKSYNKNSAVQNDFSFYRRALGKINRHPGTPVSEVEANNISSFIAQPTPIIAAFIVTMDNLQRQIQVTQFLADFAHVCCANVMMDKTRNQANAKFSFTAMVVAIVVYDQISPTGVFTSSQIQLKTCLFQLKMLLPVEDRGALSDALQYTTKTYNKAPEAIKKLISVR